MSIAPLPRSVIEEEAELTGRIAAGDEAALQELHRRYAPLVFHLACKSLDRAAAEEITQDVFLAAWRKAGSHDPQRGSVRTWLLSITHHRILDEYRARTRRPRLDGAAEDLELAAQDPLPDEALWRDYQRRTIAEALDALPGPQRRALALAYFGELSQERVAQALDIPLGTAKTRIRSGLRGLAGRLGILVAGLLLLALPAGRMVRDGRRSQRALAALANSHLRVQKLYAPGQPAPSEAVLHAAFRAVPGQDLAVLTLAHFPAPPAGRRYVLWLDLPGGRRGFDLPGPGQDGKALAILEDCLGGGWPVALTITAEAERSPVPSGPVIARWDGSAAAI